MFCLFFKHILLLNYLLFTVSMCLLVYVDLLKFILLASFIFCVLSCSFILKTEYWLDLCVAGENLHVGPFSLTALVDTNTVTNIYE